MQIDPLIALGVVAATMLNDAVSVLYTASVAHRRDFSAANWGAMTYMLSAYAVISFTSNWAYVVFAALGSWIGAFATMRYLRWRSTCVTEKEQAPSAPAPANAAPCNAVAEGVDGTLPPPTFASGTRLAA